MLIGLTLGLLSAANAACLDLKQTNVLSFEGTLSYRKSIVRTTQVSGSNLIESIKAVSGC